MDDNLNSGYFTIEGNKNFLVGNKNIVAGFCGADILFIRENTGTKSNLITLVSETDVKCISKSRGHLITSHTVYTKENGNDDFLKVECIIQDCMHPVKNIFARRFSSPFRYVFSLSLPTHCHLSYIENYYISSHTVKCITIANRNDSVRLYMLLLGNVNFEPITRRLSLEAGQGQIIIVLGTPQDAVKNLTYAFDNIAFSNVRSLEPLHRIYWEAVASSAKSEEIAKEFKKELTIESPLSDKICDICESFVYSVFSAENDNKGYFSKTNGLLDSTDELILTHSLICCKMYREAKNLLLKNAKDSDSDISNAVYFSLALLEYAKNVPADFALFKELFPYFKKALHMMCKQQIAATMPFSYSDSCFAALLTPQARFQGSSDMTLRFITIVSMLLKLAKEKDLSAFVDSKDIEFYQNAQIRAINGFEENFVHGNNIALNCSKRESHIKKPRILFGYCDTCSILGKNSSPDWIEKTRQGYYICHECYQRIDEIAYEYGDLLSYSPNSPVFSLTSLLLHYYYDSPINKNIDTASTINKAILSPEELSYTDTCLALVFASEYNQMALNGLYLHICSMWEKENSSLGLAQKAVLINCIHKSSQTLKRKSTTSPSFIT